MLNVKDEPVVINLPQFGSQAKDVYWFTLGAKDVLSQAIKLNDVIMDSSGKTEIIFSPKNIREPIEMPALSYGFIVIPEANVERAIKLNDVIMDSSGKTEIIFSPKNIREPIEMPALSYGFIVIPEANVEMCHDQPPATKVESRESVAKHTKHSHSTGISTRLEM
uniref:Uncharacterized protein n=1 Tax=Biomphalaria glabrata TaxID=6526 RepID=A0A2C9LIE6_BIOGL